MLKIDSRYKIATTKYFNKDQNGYLNKQFLT